MYGLWGRDSIILRGCSTSGKVSAVLTTTSQGELWKNLSKTGFQKVNSSPERTLTRCWMNITRPGFGTARVSQKLKNCLNLVLILPSRIFPVKMSEINVKVRGVSVFEQILGSREREIYLQEGESL